MSEWWSVPRAWEGQTAFIVGGGPSVRDQNIDLLRGRKVIAINSSYETIPFADYLIYHDPVWWKEHKEKLQAYKGRIVNPNTVHPRCSMRVFLRKEKPPGLSTSTEAVKMSRTTFTAAINLAVHLTGAGGRIVLLGADGQSKDGRSHHHRPHSWWKPNPKRWDIHRDELMTLVEPLQKLSIDVVNASPGSAWSMWPVMTLEQAINSPLQQAA